MRNVKMVSLFALLAVACGSGAVLAQAGHPPVSNHGARSPANVAAKISALLKKHPHGGNSLILAIEHLLQGDPGAISDVIYAATNEANAEQALALEQGVVQTLAEMKKADPVGARTIQSYLDANKTNAAVAQILSAEGAQGAIPGGGGGGNGGGLGGGSSGGGGFVGGGGSTVSRH